MSIQNNFPSNLAYLRKKMNMSRDQLADALSKDSSTIGKWENGSRSPNVEDTIKICDFFNISLDDIIITNMQLDENHTLDAIIMDKTKELSEEDKQKIIDLIEIYKK